MTELESPLATLGVDPDRLDLLDEDLLALEHDPDRPDVLSRIVGTMAHVEAAAIACGLDGIEELAGAGAELVTGLIDGTRRATPGVVTLLVRLAGALHDGLSNGGATPEDERELCGLLRSAGMGPLRLGDLLVERGAVAAEVVEEAALAQGLGDSRSIGQILVDRGAVAPAEIDAVLRAQAERVYAPEGTVAVPRRTLDRLVALAGDLTRAAHRLRATPSVLADPAAAAAARRADRVSVALRDVVAAARARPVRQAWEDVAAGTRERAAAMGKHVRVETKGGDTAVDAVALDALREPLARLVRHAVDHSIETPEERRRAGKPEEGTVSLTALADDRWIVVQVVDDGDGRVDEWPVQSVAAGLAAVGATVEMSCTPGMGATATVRLPASVDIVPALLVTAAGQRFALPRSQIREVIRWSPTGAGQLVDDVPVVSLRAALAIGDAGTPAGAVVVCDADAFVFGLAVDDLGDREDLAVLPLGRHLAGIPVYGGAAVTSSGQVALLIDAGGLAATAGILGPGPGDAESR